jgi:hypothetical protein
VSVNTQIKKYFNLQPLADELAERYQVPCHLTYGKDHLKNLLAEEKRSRDLWEAAQQGGVLMEDFWKND